MSDQELFKSTETEQQNTGDPSSSSSDPFADKLKEIRNEKGEPKYSDLSTALDALKHSQDFIPNLQNENKTKDEEIRQLKAELEKRESVEAALEKLTGKQHQTKDDHPQSGGIDAETLNKLIEQKLAQQGQQQTAQSNLDMVQKALSEKYGESAKDMIAMQARESETTPEQLAKLAMTNPKLVLRMFEGVEVSKDKSATSSHTPSRNRDSGNEPPKFEKSLMRGQTSADQVEAMRKIREYTYKRLGVET